MEPPRIDDSKAPSSHGMNEISDCLLRDVVPLLNEGLFQLRESLRLNWSCTNCQVKNVPQMFDRIQTRRVRGLGVKDWNVIWGMGGGLVGTGFF